MSTTPAGVATRRATRPVEGRWVAGVCGGLAAHLHLRVQVVRVAFVVLALTGAVGIVLYAALWAVLPLTTSDPALDVRAARAADTGRLLALAALVVGAGLLLTAYGVDVLAGTVLPLIVAAFGAALIWRQTDDEQRDRWSQAAGRAARQTAGTSAGAGRWRVLAGGVLVGLALMALAVGRLDATAAIQGMAVALLVILGISLVAFPWLYRIWREQVEQRRALIRSEERAEMAAHVHDSVLQTLTLIQRYADDASEVGRLARAEERHLRTWLYAPMGDPERTFAAALQKAAEDVETAFGATFDVVVVGDAVLDPQVTASVAAAREAMVNAAKHAGGQVSVYAECSDDALEVFVRDRGPGFSVADIAEDRHGVRSSIIGRMERNGGTAIIRALPVGTEVHLHVHRSSKESA